MKQKMKKLFLLGILALGLSSLCFANNSNSLLLGQYSTNYILKIAWIHRDIIDRTITLVSVLNQESQASQTRGNAQLETGLIAFMTPTARIGSDAFEAIIEIRASWLNAQGKIEKFNVNKRSIKLEHGKKQIFSTPDGQYSLELTAGILDN